MPELAGGTAATRVAAGADPTAVDIDAVGAHDVLSFSHRQLTARFLERLYDRRAAERMPALFVDRGRFRPRQNSAAASRGLVSLLTHCNGFDAFMGARTICPLPLSPPTTEAPLTCSETRHCHRHDLSFDDPVLNDHLVSIDQIAGRIVFLGGCFGLPLWPRAPDLRWTLAGQLLAHPGVEVLITSWKTILAPHDLLLAVHADLAGGLTAAEAVARHNSRPETRLSGSYLCLLGDPAARLDTPSPAIDLYDFVAGDHSRTCSRSEKAAATFISRYIGQVRPDLAREAGDLRPVAAALLAERGMQIFRDWSRDRAVLIQRKSQPCTCGEACGEQFIFRLDGIADFPSYRSLRFCPICGFTGDAPLVTSANITIGSKPDHVRADFDLPAPSLCGLRLETQAVGAAGLVTAGFAAGSRYLELPVASPAGHAPLFAYAFIIDHDEVQITGRKLR
jgi:hypothetical protein